LEHRLVLSAGFVGTGDIDLTAASPHIGDPPEIRTMALGDFAASSRHFAESHDFSADRSVRRANGVVGMSDASDIYRFQLPEPSEVAIQLTGLRADIDLRIYNQAGTRIGLSDNSRTRSESFAAQLPAGTYYAEVYAYRYFDVSRYQLELTTQPIAPARPPNAPARQDPGPISPQPTPVSSPSEPRESPPRVDPIEPFPDVPYFGGQNEWNLNAINVPEVWAQGYTGQDVIVAVLDTGVDRQHADLISNMWVNSDEILGNRRDDDRNGYVDDVYGWDFVHNDNNPVDRNGHGTHIAGTIAAARNGLGVTGIAPDATIMPVQVLGADGSGSLSDVAAGIRYAVDNGAEVINLSLGSGGDSRALRAALDYAQQSGVLVVAAAGNSGDRIPDLPARLSASLSNVVSVGAHDSRDRLAAFSNRVGSSGAVQVDAPGVGVVSTFMEDEYARLTGTSMAAPHVAGLAALALSANPVLSAADLRTLIVDWASRSISGSDSRNGINAAYTVAVAEATRASGAAAIASRASPSSLAPSPVSTSNRARISVSRGYDAPIAELSAHNESAAAQPLSPRGRHSVTSAEQELLHRRHQVTHDRLAADHVPIPSAQLIPGTMVRSSSDWCGQVAQAAPHGDRQRQQLDVDRSIWNAAVHWH
jgi:subtilisin family serine protease